MPTLMKSWSIPLQSSHVHDLSLTWTCELRSLWTQGWGNLKTALKDRGDIFVQNFHQKFMNVPRLTINTDFMSQQTVQHDWREFNVTVESWVDEETDDSLNFSQRHIWSKEDMKQMAEVLQFKDFKHEGLEGPLLLLWAMKLCFHEHAVHVLDIHLIVARSCILLQWRDCRNRVYCKQLSSSFWS